MARVKTCFKCRRSLPLAEFYRHDHTTDGRLGKCKACTRADVAANRLANLDRIREYDRQRANLPHRKDLRKRVLKQWRARYPLRSRTHLRAERKHRKAPDACQMCGLLGKRLERHHPDYELPLLIVWLCKPCHAVADKQRRAKETSR
jgi:hypothetical protein